MMSAMGVTLISEDSRFRDKPRLSIVGLLSNAGIFHREFCYRPEIAGFVVSIVLDADSGIRFRPSSALLNSFPIRLARILLSPAFFAEDRPDCVSRQLVERNVLRGLAFFLFGNVHHQNSGMAEFDFFAAV
jgi:hypothetical protein